MLKVSALENSTSKWPLWNSFDPFRAVWIVSDLRSKIELQSHLLKDRAGIPGDSVLRAHEYWRQIFSRAYPLFQPLPLEWSQVVADRLLDDDQFKKFPALRGTVVNLMNLISPVLFHPDRLEILGGLLTQHPGLDERFGKLLPHVIVLFDHLIGNKWIPETWIPAALESWGIPNSVQFQPMIFDLGASLTSVEADLIEVIAQKTDVHVLIPSPKFAEAFQFLLAPSQQLFDRAAERDSLPGEAEQVSSDFLKFSGRLAEVRNSVGQIREWLDEGVPISNIAIVTPFFEQDLAVMEQYFRVEGIPLSRTTGLRVQSIAAVQSALARLRLSSSDLRFSDLELSFRNGVPERFEKFSANFREAMDATDLHRSNRVREQVEPWLTVEKEIGLEEFFTIVSSVWPKEGPGSMSAVFNDLFENTPRFWKQTPRAWVAWLEKRVARIEYNNPENLGGLQILPLKSADFPGLTHRLFLGMVEKLPELNQRLLSAEEISSLGWDYGFFLSHPEQTVLQFEIQWLIAQSAERNIFCYPATDWTGGLNSPQAFWLKGAGDQHDLTTTPKSCRWDEIQSAIQDDAVEPRIQRDLGEKPVEPLPPGQLSYSISSIERFSNCPFIFTAEKRFALKDQAIVDLEIDRMGTGQFYHRLAELLTEPPIRWDRSDQELTSLIEKIRTEMTDFNVEPSLWSAFSNRAQQLARRFLAYEKKWQNEFPRHEVLEREKDFEFGYNFQDKKWTASAEAPAVKIRGRIDRISGIADGPVGVYDYKSSTSAKHTARQWKTKGTYQLGFYAWALNEGLIDEKYRGRIVSAAYYNLKKMDSSIGYQTDAGVGQFYRKVKPRDFDRAKAEGELIAEVTHHLERAQSGECAPRPREPEKCNRCEWRNLCRSPHLQV